MNADIEYSVTSSVDERSHLYAPTFCLRKKWSSLIKEVAYQTRCVLCHVHVAPFCVLFLLFFFSLPAFSELYQITDISYSLEKTREKDLERLVPVNTERIFESEKELESYLSDLKQRLLNTRAFDEVELKVESGKWKDENGKLKDETFDSQLSTLNSGELIPVSLQITARDTKSLLILPYPKYDSNDGLIFKVKVKDVNFFGTMNTLNAGLFAGLKEDTESGKQNPTFGAEFNYSYPFYLKDLPAFWNNDFEIKYTAGVEELEFWNSTGFTFEKEFKKLSFVLDLSEHADRDLEYMQYGDTQYYTSDLNFSLPVKIADIENWGYIFLTPFLDTKVNYDKDGISSQNDDLAGPVLKGGLKLSSSRINWYGNFRTGLSASVSFSDGYDFMQKESEPCFKAEIQAFKAFRYCGINSRLTVFLTRSNRDKVGELIRGARDKQKYLNTENLPLKTELSLKSPSALVFNLDLPFHIITTDWLGWSDSLFGSDSWFSRTFSWTDKFNFELQLSPFIDIALTKNEITDRLFSLKDGWYTGGLEFLVFPERWKGIVVRGSIGLDLGKALIAKKYPEKIDLSWRENVKKYEIYAGIGLHY